jgi:hypothetical protein
MCAPRSGGEQVRRDERDSDLGPGRVAAFASVTITRKVPWGRHDVGGAAGSASASGTAEAGHRGSSDSPSTRLMSGGMGLAGAANVGESALVEREDVL